MTLSCPSDDELLTLKLTPGDVAARVARHVATCASCRMRTAVLMSPVGDLRATRSPVHPGPDCLDDVSLAALIDGTGDAVARREGIAHVAQCNWCHATVSAVAALVATPAIAAVIDDLAPSRRLTPRRAMLGGGMLAATAAIALIITAPWRSRPVILHRDAAITALLAPVPVAPLGDVVHAPDFRWNFVTGADRFRVTLLDEHGTLVFETETTDTTVALPDSITLMPGRPYLWKVSARTALNRWAASSLTEFRIIPAGTPPAPDTASAPTPSDSLMALAGNAAELVLVAATRAHSMPARDAVMRLLLRSVAEHGAASAGDLAGARRLAAAYAVAWRDSFPLRQVSAFVAATPPRRSAVVWIDSVRRAGNAVYQHDGPAAARAVWQRALRRAAMIGDSAQIAATLGNIGSAWLQDDQLDSADAALTQTRSLAAAIRNIPVEANATAALAGVAQARHDLARARDMYAAAIVMRQRIGDSRGLAADDNNLAGLARDAGDLGEARRQLENALAINRHDGRLEVAATNLVNLAELAMLAGDFIQADAYYHQALDTWQRRGELLDAADALRGLADLDVRRGDYPSAQRELTTALHTYRRTGPVLDAIAVERRLGDVRAAQGDLQGGMDDLRAAQDSATAQHAAPGVQAAIVLDRARLARRLNDVVQAERLYADAAALFHRAGDVGGEADARAAAGALYIDQDDLPRAGALLNAAVTGELAAGDIRGAAITRLELAAWLFRRGDTTGARRQLVDAAHQLLQLHDPVAAAAAIGEEASLAAAARLPAVAESLFRRALATLGNRVAPDVSWRLHAGLGAARAAEGASADAERELRVAVDAIEHVGGSLRLPERRSGFLEDKWDVYVTLAAVVRSRGATGAAFDVSERVRSGEMLEMLNSGRVAVPAASGAAVVAREQDLRRQITDLTRGLEHADAPSLTIRGPDVSTASAATRQALTRAQSEYSDLLLDMRERAPQHAALVSRQPVDWHDVARKLAPDDVLIEYLVGDTASVAFVVTRDTLVAVALPVDRAELARLIDFSRGILEPRGAPQVDSLWRAPLRQLYRDLIAPVVATHLLADKTQLIIVPHAELHYLPFAALIDGETPARFLVEQFRIETAPSAAVWTALHARNPGTGTGVLALAPWPDRLPGSREEVQAIGRLAGPSGLVAVGSAATRAAFRRAATNRGVIHLATYGVLNKQNPLFSFVELAPGGGDDGRLQVYDVFGLTLNADLVVLSACQTALASGMQADVPPGDDWIGLARAFLSAGAAHVMASLWSVQDRATADLMQQFYRRYLVSHDAVSALAATQRVMLHAADTSNPYYWAGFEVIGGTP